MAAHPFEASQQVERAPRRPWVKPAVADLPRLTELTLATPGIPGSGSPGGGGSTVIP